MGLPYRRGYLFSAKPGTDKTILINAISATYNCDLYYINLQDIKSDNELQSAFSSVSKNSIIVFDDIDAQSAEVHSRERRFALKKVDKLRALKEKELEFKQKKREAAEAKLIESETNTEVTEDDSVKKLKKTLNDIWKEDDEDDVFEVLDPALIRPGRYQMNRLYQSIMDNKNVYIDFDAYPIPEHVIAPCDALRIMILYRPNPSVIPIRLMERVNIKCLSVSLLSTNHNLPPTL
ncbi:UNVERIFIED_CONTAM: hypothetical protein HDU68_002582 [Siphonaria sp. JEL0065]|nr:hypothetical protein HDU68_002582 [Siphonaria sp. JEL0065]